MHSVFIDGKSGTCGLQIYERLSKRQDIEIISLSEERRRDEKARAECLNSAEISFLCLPDDAAARAAELIKNPNARVIDASTAHRTAPGWVYGFPELSAKRRAEIAAAKRVANPGCYATGFIAIAAPLVKGGFVAADYPFTVFGLSGYSGGGKKAIAEYESEKRNRFLEAPRHYALALAHKHIPEMVAECGLTRKPLFNPVICDFYCGMSVSVPIHVSMMAKKASSDAIREYFAEYYARQNFVKVPPASGIPDYLPANLLAGTNELHIFVGGNGEQIFISSVLDNLGKGASGAAVQNMNIMLGLDERISLV